MRLTRQQQNLTIMREWIIVNIAVVIIFINWKGGKWKKIDWFAACCLSILASTTIIGFPLYAFIKYIMY